MQTVTVFDMLSEFSEYIFLMQTPKRPREDGIVYAR